jgi:hypothetical protein
LAVTEKLTEAPISLTAEVGWPVMDGGGLTVTIAAIELALAHDPLWTTARKYLVAVRLPVFNELAVEAMGDQGPPSGEDSHLTMEPVWPLRLIVVEEPLQRVPAVAAAVPPALAGSTVTVAALESTMVQPPLWTIARNWVVVVRLPVVSGLSVEAMGV